MLWTTGAARFLCEKNHRSGIVNDTRLASANVFAFESVQICFVAKSGVGFKTTAAAVANTWVNEFYINSFSSCLHFCLLLIVSNVSCECRRVQPVYILFFPLGGARGLLLFYCLDISQTLCTPIVSFGY